MGCAQLGQCGDGGFDLLVFSLRMNRTPHLKPPRQSEEQRERAGPSREIDQLELSKNRRSRRAGRWYAVHYCGMARILIFGNRRAQCGEESYSFLINYAGILTFDFAPKVRTNSRRLV